MTEEEEGLYKKFCPVGATATVKERVRKCVQCIYFNPIHRSHCPYCSCDWSEYVKKMDKKCVKGYW